MEVKQQEHKPESILDASITDSTITHYATMPAHEQFIFSKSNKIHLTSPNVYLSCRHKIEVFFKI